MKLQPYRVKVAAIAMLIFGTASAQQFVQHPNAGEGALREDQPPFPRQAPERHGSITRDYGCKFWTKPAVGSGGGHLNYWSNGTEICHQCRPERCESGNWRPGHFRCDDPDLDAAYKEGSAPLQDYFGGQCVTDPNRDLVRSEPKSEETTSDLLQQMQARSNNGELGNLGSETGTTVAAAEDERRRWCIDQVNNLAPSITAAAAVGSATSIGASCLLQASTLRGVLGRIPARCADINEVATLVNVIMQQISQANACASSVSGPVR